MEQFAVMYISFDGGYSYRQARFTEKTFKDRIWITACKWLRPDGAMTSVGYGVDIIIRRKDLSHIGTLHIKGGDSLGVIWQAVCEMWEMVKVEI